MTMRCRLMKFARFVEGASSTGLVLEHFLLCYDEQDDLRGRVQYSFFRRTRPDAGCWWPGEAV